MTHGALNLAALYSGGKDSTYSMLLARRMGHRIKCLLTMLPHSNESLLLHHPGVWWTRLQSESMHVPQLMKKADSVDAAEELASMKSLLLEARQKFKIEGVVHGGISSEFQRSRFGEMCAECGLEVLLPLWGRGSGSYMAELEKCGIAYVIVSVSAGGLDGSWLGRTITSSDLGLLESLSARHGFNMNFEGGEAETFVTDCPMFSSPIRICGTAHWDGYRGRFEISDARLLNNA